MLKKLVATDVVSHIGTALERDGWFIDQESGRYSCKGRAFHDSNRPWIYVNPDPKRGCGVYQKIVSNLGFIPSACLECWKIVVAPRTLHELMKLKEFQENFTKDFMLKDRFCKCGIETREYVPRNYGGYFYTNSLEQGRERWRQVRNAMDKINPQIPVTLKRYCTEFEIKLGPSDQYKQPEGAKDMERRIFEAVDVQSMGDNPPQPEFLKEHILSKWMVHAWDRADLTVMMYNDGQPLYSPTITYHEE